MIYNTLHIKLKIVSDLRQAVCFSGYFGLLRAHLKKLRRAVGGANFFWVFRVKNHDFTQTNYIFSNFRVGTRRVRPPLDPPLQGYELGET
jgi:hypothetical protein